ncbi:GIY-YIG nuclease family protein [Micromonospora chokoriensis]|uniref:GIY-YIG nuclease family protein n=1 Tax=Micromonospora chokoriensis TaxID=356851 RepID=UPI0018DE0855|nr:GIY-YIG nuclease family protein [Micromonospora chokoriensis]
MGERGEVYILHNCSLREGLVKIGLTTRAAEKRANELRTTGVPGKFHVLFSQVVDDALGVENRLHTRFQEFRYDDDREFFYVSPTRAISALLEEAGIALAKPAPQGPADVLAGLRLRYGPLLDPALTAVSIEGGGEAPTTLTCLLTGAADNGAADNIVLRRDLDFVTSGGTPYFELAADSSQAAKLLFELGSYSLIVTTPVFSQRGAQLIADLHEQRQFDNRAIIDVISSAIEAEVEPTIDSIESSIRSRFSMPTTKLDIVSLQEHRGRFLVSAHRNSAPIRELSIEAITDDDDYAVDSRASYAVVTVPNIEELDFDESVDIGYRYSPPTWTTDGPRIRVAGIAPNGIPFEQHFWFMP